MKRHNLDYYMIKFNGHKAFKSINTLLNIAQQTLEIQKGPSEKELVEKIYGEIHGDDRQDQDKLNKIK